MANETKSTAPQARQEKPKSGLRLLIGTLFSTLIFSLFLSVVIECVGITFFWPEEGVMHSQNMLDNEFGYLSTDFKDSLLLSEPVLMVESVIFTLYDYIMIRTGLEALLTAPVTDSPSFVVVFLKSIGTYLMATVNIILVFIVRLFLLLLSSPIFILASIVGIVDGLVRRDIRRFGAGRESSFLYHHSKRWIGRFLILSWLLYLSIPVSIHPNLIFIPMAFLFGLSVSITFGSFKKYL